MASVLRKAFTMNPMRPVGPMVARCDSCGRECEMPDEWIPSTCPYCGHPRFPPASRARVFLVGIGLAVVGVFTAVAWYIGN